MNGKFNILHLSDAHIGHPVYSMDSLNVFDPLFEDIKTYYKKKNLKPSLIVFSGDLVYGDIHEKSIEDQYKDAEKFLKKLYECFDVDYGNIPLLIVPGNHDINRDRIDEFQKKSRSGLSESDVYNMMQKNDSTWERILERQKAWFSFVKSIPSQPWDWNDDLYLATKIIEHNGKKIGIAGLNSSWACHGEGDQGSIWMGRFQHDLACHTIKDADFRIAVTHHPVDWLNPDEKSYIAQKMETNFNIFLHGHEHSPWFIDSVGHLKATAGACYLGSQKENGYSWIEVDFSNSMASIHLREYKKQGSGVWGANHVGRKTDEKGVADLNFLKRNGKLEEYDVGPSKVMENKTSPSDPTPKNLEELIKVLEDRFYLRWERANLTKISEQPFIYWPVTLRPPTPIHAAQCFVAAGLQKVGCHISLWVDDLGHEDYMINNFVPCLKEWFKKAGGDDTRISVRRFGEILSAEKQHVKSAWEMLQKWLGNSVFKTDDILKISKLWPQNKEDSPDFVIKELKKHRLRRVMTPAMVWTCMLVLHQEKPTHTIITLGGYDEQSLWNAWRACCEPKNMKVGHLYGSKLTQITQQGEQTVEMKNKTLEWTSKEDIYNAFNINKANLEWTNQSSIIPWTINNCSILPNYIANAPPFIINKTPIYSLNDLDPFEFSAVSSHLVKAVNSWLF